MLREEGPSYGFDSWNVRSRPTRHAQKEFEGYKAAAGKKSSVSLSLLLAVSCLNNGHALFEETATGGVERPVF